MRKLNAWSLMLSGKQNNVIKVANYSAFEVHFLRLCYLIFISLESR